MLSGVFLDLHFSMIVVAHATDNQFILNLDNSVCFIVGGIAFFKYHEELGLLLYLVLIFLLGVSFCS